MRPLRPIFLRPPRIRTCQPFEYYVFGAQCFRHASTTSPSPDLSQPPKDIAVLGGGISGLSTALYLLTFHAQKYPKSSPPRITIYESKKELGGWMHTARLKRKDGTEFNVEQGPRTIRAGRRNLGAMMFYELVCSIILRKARLT